VEAAPRPTPETSRDGCSIDFEHGIRLFDQGFYWEAHEAWERLWHWLGRTGPEADLVKALIKLAAAGVKIRQGQPAGVRTHAGRARALIHSLRKAGQDVLLGLDLSVLEARAGEVENDPPTDLQGLDARVVRVFTFELEPRPGNPH
jgi:hypothetical protein